MASIYKNLTSNDVVSTRTLLHEAIPITGTLVSGTYSEANIKNYSHGRFQSVYDYPVLSSSANHIFDITVGVAPDSTNINSSATEYSKKVQIYNQMAQLLVGHDVTGSILRFDADGNFLDTTGDKMKEVLFINFSRLLTKDEIKKGNFEIKLGNGVVTTPFSSIRTVNDSGAQDDFRINSPAGEYGILKLTGGTKYGLIFYQAGIIVLNLNSGLFTAGGQFTSGKSVLATLQDLTIEDFCDEVRHRWQNCSFNNTTELNSTIYFCRVNHNEFNYSSNPTYLSGSQIRVKQTSLDAPVSYITTVGLYSSANELLAVAKLSEPLKKDPSNELIIRTRLDF